MKGNTNVGEMFETWEIQHVGFRKIYEVISTWGILDFQLGHFKSI